MGETAVRAGRPGLAFVMLHFLATVAVVPALQSSSTGHLRGMAMLSLPGQQATGFLGVRPGAKWGPNFHEYEPPEVTCQDGNKCSYDCRNLPKDATCCAVESSSGEMKYCPPSKSCLKCKTNKTNTGTEEGFNGEDWICDPTEFCQMNCQPPKKSTAVECKVQCPPPGCGGGMNTEGGYSHHHLAIEISGTSSTAVKQKSEDIVQSMGWKDISKADKAITVATSTSNSNVLNAGSSWTSSI